MQYSIILLLLAEANGLDQDVMKRLSPSFFLIVISILEQTYCNELCFNTICHKQVTYINI